MVMAAAIAVFLAGLMVGRTPEYLGKKIGPAENKMIMLYALASNVASTPEWQQSARRLVDILITGSRPMK